ncbi:hypothetical protein [Roseateles asaccharophilus]|uniref:DUF4124 domain-containing protein n=1 Tax=Roseateles asaccharophilus TaxID=582607 RepID=A0ABU2A3Q8_9BURK|nr:hypothetical protein [Roseateles asaccharophilus]MDR7331822.1 hypothetical protein [Roseateles asaccharophilus]
MSLRGLVIALVLLAGVGLAWQQRAQLRAWLGTAPPVAAAIPSFNELGTNQPARTVEGRAKLSGLRKCVNGQQVSYTNVECPAGHREQAVTAAPVNVVPATPVARPAAAASGGGGQAALHRALDVAPDEQLRERLMDRAIEGRR